MSNGLASESPSEEEAPSAERRGEGRGASAPGTDEVGARRRAVRARILEAFAGRAAQRGIRGVAMVELARDLGMSSRTLYKHFASKEELLQATVSEWLARFDAQRWRDAGGRQEVLQLLVADSGTWVELSGRVSPLFWEQLRRDYPEVQGFVGRWIARYLMEAAARVTPELRDGLTPGLALRLLIDGVMAAIRPDLCNALDLTREEALRQALGVWARGALRADERGRVELPGPG